MVNGDTPNFSECGPDQAPGQKSQILMWAWGMYKKPYLTVAQWLETEFRAVELSETYEEVCYRVTYQVLISADVFTFVVHTDRNFGGEEERFDEGGRVFNSVGVW